MPKKSKNPENGSNNGDPQPSPGSSSIFETLFSNLAEQKSFVSIFSDQNPFKRKPSDSTANEHQQQHQQLEDQHLGSGSDSVEDDAKNDFDESPNLAQATKRKRKRKRDKKRDLDLGSVDEISETPSMSKKSKEGKLIGGDLSVELEKLAVEKDKDSVKSLANSEIEGKGMGKKVKKRKRDELEAEYEAQRYGGDKEELEGKVVGQKRKKADEPWDMMAVASKKGFDDEAKLLRTLFVGNLPVKIKKKALFTLFRQFGEVESVRIRSVPLLDTKTPRKGAIMQKKINEAVDSVHAYVVFKTEEAAQASLAHNMAVVGGNHIRVDRACPPRKKLKGDEATPLYDNKRTIFVGNLPFDAKDEEVYQLFSGIKDLEPASIEAIRVIRDPGSSLGKGIAYVMFKTRAAANLVARKHGLKLRDRELRLCHAKSNATPSKRKNTSLEERDGSSSKKLASNSAAPKSKDKVKSYQGLRVSKSGVQKRGNDPKRGNQPLKFKARAQCGKMEREHKDKRPAVAARKEKALKGGSNQAGFKRKLDGRTPEGARGPPNKRAKNFR